MHRAVRLFSRSHAFKNTRLLVNPPVRLFTSNLENVNTKPTEPIAPSTKKVFPKAFDPTVRENQERASHILTLIQQDNFTKALEAIQAENEKNPLTANFIYNSFLNRAARSPSFLDLFPKILNIMAQLDVKMDSYTFAPIFNGLTYHGQTAEVEKYESLMRDSGIPLNKVLYNNLLNAYGSHKQQENLERILAEIRQDKTITIDEIMYCTIVKVYGKMKIIDKVEAIMQEMQTKGIVCDTICYNIIIDLCATQGFVEKMRDHFTAMKKNNQKPTVATFASLIFGYLKQGLGNDAYIILKEMNNNGLPPNTETMNIFLQKFKNRGDGLNLRKCYDIFRKQFVKPDIRSIIFLISYYMKMNDINGINFCINEMRENNIKPDSILAHTLLKYYGMIKDYDHFTHVVAELQKIGQWDAELYRTIIDGFHRCGKNDLALEYFHKMRKKYPIDRNLYHLILEIYGDMKDSQKLEETWQNYIQNGFKVDGEICDVKIRGLLNCGLKDDAKKIVLENKENSAQIYKTFLRLYLKYVQENPVKPDIRLIKAVRRVSDTLSGIDKLEPEEIVRINTLVNSL